ncbi:protein msta-like [Copidosoma floridanum]|uniref:protein msta-like n=1 Tax=Copidosoma floridanum TaxID=29053 RepID=UPI0006C97893|nr:protein msta-like [Copidosoma floridanum]
MDKKSAIAPCAVKKYKVMKSDKLGRYLVASKDLAAGELIFREEAVAVGPGIGEPGAFCFGCLRPLTQHRQARRYSCTKCTVAPLCNRACEVYTFHNMGGLHSGAECDFFRDNKEVCSELVDEVTRVLLHLRLWLLKSSDEESSSWKEIERMEAHLEQRRGTDVWREREEQVVDVFRKLGLHHPKTTSDEDDLVQRICGIVDVNTFEVRVPGLYSNGSGGAPLRGLFVEAALMAHECRPTAHVSVDESFNMSVHAALAVPADGIISFNYTSSLLGTIDRQEHLQIGKYFRCDCAVCTDPLESGSHLSCLLCPRCKVGPVAPPRIGKTISNPYSREARWQCQECKHQLSGCLVASSLGIARGLVDEVDELGSFKAMENLLAKLVLSFHGNHYLVMALKNKMLGACRREIGSVNPQKKLLGRMVQLGREVLAVLEIVEPGLSRLKGIVLYELHLPMTILANRAYAAREITAPELVSRLEEARDLLRRALGMLLLEPVMTPEGQLARRALREMKVLARSVEDARALADGPKISLRRRGSFKHCGRS